MRPIDLERRQAVASELERRGLDANRIMTALDANPSALLPYHGTPHILVVALAVLDLSVGEELTPDETSDVFLAAIFHDYDYAGSSDDTANVERAAAAARLHVYALRVERVTRLILASRYPYTAPPADKLEEVLRDADVAFSTLLVPDAQHFRNEPFGERGAPAGERAALAFIIGHRLNTGTAARLVHAHMSAVKEISQRRDLET